MEIPHRIESLAQLTELYREPGRGAVDKQLDRMTPGMAGFIDSSSFLVLATTSGDGSVDASPRGGPPGFVRRLDERHIAIPDLNGNNRLDSYRNVVAHPYVGILMLVPGKDETLRINGPATLTTDPELLAGFTKELRTPKMALVVETAEIYGHCAKAFRRGGMWQPDSWAAPCDAPDLSDMYAAEGEAEQLRAALEVDYAAGLAAD
jgi:PPOX class probable FMN-dependent enzyme